jgi:hypothetical protein
MSGTDLAFANLWWAVLEGDRDKARALFVAERQRTLDDVLALLKDCRIEVHSSRSTPKSGFHATYQHFIDDLNALRTVEDK